MLSARTKARITKSAITDHLTSLHNRRYFDRCLKEVTRVCRRRKGTFSLLMIDIDGFKSINDRYGHLSGDRVLTTFARLLKASTRRDDICFRYGGDELTVVLPDATRATADEVVERITKRIEGHPFLADDDQALHLKISIGIATFPQDGQSPQELLRKADESLYRLKRLKQTSRKDLSEPLVLKTKLALPGIKENVVRRAHLVSLLSGQLSRRLILIVADAGYGKTTLLSQFIRDQNLPAVFYHLEREDGDFVVFFAHLVHGIEQIDPTLVERTKGLLSHAHELGRNYEIAMGTLINEILEKRRARLFLFLDDYHALAEDSLVHRALDYLIDRLPDSLQMTIATRSVPPLSNLAKWRSKQDLFELSRDGLRFAPVEIKMLLSEVYRTSISDAEVQQVSEKTEGWVTGIQLILQSAGIEGKTVKGTLNSYLAAHQPLFEYFANEIFLREVSAVKDFLTKSSILDHITPDVCRYVFNMPDAERQLRDIAQRNLFFSSVGAGEYRYHRLFRDFLSAQLTDKGLERALLLKTADYYKQKKHFEPAVDYYLKAGAYDSAIQLIVRVAEHMIQRTQLTTLRRWLEVIPGEKSDRDPDLLLIRAGLSRITGAIDEAESCANQAERLLAESRNYVLLTDVLVESAWIKWSRRDYRGAIATLRRALRICPSRQTRHLVRINNVLGASWLESGNVRKGKFHLLTAIRLAKKVRWYDMATTVEGNLAVAVGRAGQVRPACDIMRNVIARFRNRYRFRIGLSFANAASFAIENGDLEWAEQCLQDGWALCKPYQDEWSHAHLHRGLAMLYAHKADWGRAIEHLEKARDFFRRLEFTPGEFICVLRIGTVNRCRGSLEQAQRCLEQAGQMIGDANSLNGMNLLSETAFIQVAQGQFKKARQTVREYSSIARRLGFKAGLLTAGVARTAIELGEHRDKEARNCLLKTMTLAQTYGYRGSLRFELWQQPRLAALAQSMAAGPLRRDARTDYLRRLLDEFPEIIKARNLEIRLLGQFDLLVNGMPKFEGRGRRTTVAIFAYFLLHPRECTSWEEFVAWAWPDSAPHTSHQMFKNALTEIRHWIPALSSAIICEGDCYSLAPDLPISVDALTFQELLERTGAATETQRVALLEEAIALYRGPLLRGFFYPWLDDMRSVLETRYTKALGALAHLYAGRRDHERSIACCLKSLEVDRLDEEVHQRLIASYLELGQRARALRQYEKLKHILHKELKAVPSPETTALIASQK